MPIKRSYWRLSAISAVLTTDKIYDAFYDNYTSQKAFLHSHSYTGNVLACPAALATLTIFETQNIFENNTCLAAKMAELSKRFIDLPHVSDVHQTGMI